MNKIAWVSIIMIGVLFSCSNSNEGKKEGSEKKVSEITTIEGKWQMQTMQSDIEVPEDKKALVNSLFQEVADNTWMHFKKNGKLNSQTKIGDDIVHQSGNWSLKGSRIITSTNEQGEEEFTIVSIEEKQLVLSTLQQGQNITMTFTKANS